MTDDVRKLLGGYATGTLTDEEKRKLFDAALDDSALFQALADEQALKDLLDDPAARAQALQATETHVFSVTALLREWFERPKSKLLAATGAVLLIAIAFTTIRDQRRPPAYQIARSSEPTVEPRLAPITPGPENKAESRATVPPAPSSKPRTARPAPQPPPASPPTPAQPEKKEVASADAVVTAKGDPEAEKRDLQRTEPMLISATASAVPPVASSFLSQQPARSVATGTSTLKYLLLRRSPAGEYAPAPLNAQLEANEEARLAIEADEAGTISLARDDSNSVTSAVVEPKRPATFSLPAATRSLKIFFVSASAPVVDNTLLPAFQRSQERAKLSSAPVAEGQKPAAGRTPVQIEIKLNRK